MINLKKCIGSYLRVLLSVNMSLKSDMKYDKKYEWLTKLILQILVGFNPSDILSFQGFVTEDYKTSKLLLLTIRENLEAKIVFQFRQVTIDTAGCEELCYLRKNGFRVKSNLCLHYRDLWFCQWESKHYWSGDNNIFT